MNEDNSNLPPGITQGHEIWNDQCSICKSSIICAHYGLDSDEIRKFIEDKKENQYQL